MLQVIKIMNFVSVSRLSNIMHILKQSIHYRSMALSTHGISTFEIFDRSTHVGDCHVEIVVLLMDCGLL